MTERSDPSTGLLYLSRVKWIGSKHVLNPMGMAVIDVACAKAIYYRARQAKIGTWLSR